MTRSLIVGERPLPVVLRPARDELLSSWLRRHVNFYGVTEPMFAAWLSLGTKNLRGLDGRLGLGQMARIVEKFRCDPKAVLEMTHVQLPTEFTQMVCYGRPSQFCHSCWEEHLAADAQGVVMKSWREGWRVTCPVCGSPLSEGDRPRSTDHTVRDTSPFSTHWDSARKGEDILNGRLIGKPTQLASPVSMMRLLLILGRSKAETPSGLYRKSWLLNEVVPGFDAEALRFSPSISKGAVALVPLHLRVALLAGLAFAATDAVGTIRRLRTRCRQFYVSRFDEIAAAAIGGGVDFSF